MFKRFFSASQDKNRTSGAWKHIKKGIQFFEAEHHDDAIFEYSRAIYLDSKAEYAYANRAVALQAKGMYRPALVDINKAIKFNKNEVTFLGVRASLNIYTGNWNQVISDCSYVLQQRNLTVEYQSAFLGLSIWAKQQKNDLSLTQDIDTYIRLLKVRIQSNPELSKAAPMGVIAQDIGMEGMLMSFAYNAQKHGKLEEALENFTQVTKINPNNSIAYYKKSLIYLSQKQASPALRDLDHAIKVDISFAQNYYYRGIAYWTLGNYQRAMTEFFAYIQLGGDPKKVTGDQIQATIQSLSN